MYEMKAKKDQLHIQKEEVIKRVQDNQDKINQLSEDSKDLRSDNEIVKQKIEEKLKENPLVIELEGQKELVAEEITQLKKQLDELKADHKKKAELWNELAFYKAQEKLWK